MKLLFLEDDGFISRLTREALEKDGYTVKHAKRTDVADKLLENDSFDCIITDLNMSDEWLDDHHIESCGCLLTGWVWLRYCVRSSDKTKDIPCIIYSGYIDELKKELSKKYELHLINDFSIKLVEKGADNNQGISQLKKELKEVLESR